MVNRDFCTRNEPRRGSNIFAKIDVEGHEGPVLREVTSVLKRTWCSRSEHEISWNRSMFRSDRRARAEK